MPLRAVGQTFPLLYRYCIGSLTNPLRSGSDGTIFNELRYDLPSFPAASLMIERLSWSIRTETGEARLVAILPPASLQDFLS